ncbi:flagellar filament capping protein FliD [Lachnospiraceae bacterium 62-35]
MASLSSSSVSSANSLGNTSLRGFGGMASGIDRDAIIEQMTLGTNTKITNQQSAITKLEWKQEAYRGISDKILDLYDNYSSYASSSNLKDPFFFAKSLISVHGKESSTQFVTAAGTSQLVNNVTLQSVRQLATASVRKSEMRTNGKITTSLTNLEDTLMQSSNLVGRQLRFGVKSSDDKWTTKTFELPATYKDDDGKTVEISYFPEEDARKEAEAEAKKEANGDEALYEQLYKEKFDAIYQKKCEELADGLNKALEQSGITFSSDSSGSSADKASDAIQFVYKNGKMLIETKDANKLHGYQIQSNSSALAGLGYKGPKGEGSTINGIDLSDFGKEENFDDLKVASVRDINSIDYMTDKKLTFNLDGIKKEIELITSDEAEAMKAKAQEIRDQAIADGKDPDSDEVKNSIAEAQMGILKDSLQSRLDKAYGKDAVKLDFDSNHALTFETKADSTVSITAEDAVVLWNLGLQNGSSNKINMSGNLKQSIFFDIKNDGTDADNAKIDEMNKMLEDGLVINGVKIDGITADTSINDILSKINSSKAGVKATYVGATGQFMLVSSETGAGREIDLGDKDSLAAKLFGGSEANGAGIVEGQNAIIEVSYGNGVNVLMERSSNTFDLEGMSVTVSGLFGGEWVDTTTQKEDADGNKIFDADGNPVMEQTWKGNTSEAVSFSAKADVDKVTEKVKSFFEAFNAIATEVNTQVTSRPDSSYGPLTEEQKNEMSDTSIENWEKKAKTGLLFNDSTMRDLSGDIQAIFSNLMSSGASYDDLKKIGISYSEDYKDGGTIVFDEAAFRSAMESDPDLVSDIFTGGGNVSKGLTKIVEDTFTPYATKFATRNGNSYGRLIEEAGSVKVPTSILNNAIYKEIEAKKTLIEQLREKLSIEQDRYISQFTTMETMINQMNSQASYLSQLTG